MQFVVSSWLVRSTQDQTVRVRALAADIFLGKTLDERYFDCGYQASLTTKRFQRIISFLPWLLFLIDYTYSLVIGDSPFDESNQCPIHV